MKQEFGSLLHLYLEDIEIDNAIEKSEFLIAGAAKAINDAGGYNCIPVIVEQIDRNKYKVVANSFIYAAAEMAQMDRIWCIVVDDSEQTKRCAKIIAQESLPQIDLANATFEEIRMGLDYLINRPENKLSGVKLAIASNRIADAEKQSWKSSLIDVTKLKCGITKGKKLNIFKEIFYLTSIPVDEKHTEQKTDISSLKKLTVKELRKLAKERKISRYSKMNKADLIKALSE
jgi:hypothetical protein